MLQRTRLSGIDPSIATGRSSSMFNADMTSNHDVLGAAIKDRKVLAIGAAGSIGSSTVHVFSNFGPRSLHIIDQNENALAEIVRQFRSRHDGFNISDFRTLPLDYGSLATRQFLHSQSTYDVVLNFAAIKHVRSEKDSFSTLQMFDTNILKQARFLGWLGETSFDGKYFSVSTDKAANPSSLMGATKRVMEHVMFAGEGRSAISKAKVSSARFANVAFSNGSLLESFINRLRRLEPIACPSGIKRFFVSLEESGQICTLASLLAPDAHIAIPRLNPKNHLTPLEDVARRFIHANGLEPRVYTDELEAIRSVESDLNKGCYPLLLTPANTSGEKPYEEFVSKNESVHEIGLSGLRSVPYLPSNGDVNLTVNKIQKALGDQSNLTDIDDLKAFIAELEPEFLDTHVKSELNLDQRA